MLVETDTENVTVTVVVTGLVLVEVSKIQKQFLLLEVVSILYVLVVHIVVVLENVQDVKDVLHMSMDQVYLTSVP